MKRVQIAAAMALLISSSAFAADLGSKRPSPPPLMTAFSWTGFYIGADAGYVTGRSKLSAPVIPTVSNATVDGFTLGLHAGYRFQLQNNVVVGAEVRGFGNFGTRTTREFTGLAPISARVETRWGGDARLSLGYAMDRFLPYITGGIALADGRGCGVFAPGAPCIAGTSFSDTRFGWTIGAGLAYAFTNNLIARVDYSYSSFGGKTYTLPGFGINARSSFDLHAVRAGLSYKF